MPTDPDSGRWRLARVVSQAALLVLAALTAKEWTSVLLVLPVALCGLIAAARNDNAEVDAIDVYWLLSTLFFVVRPAQTLAQGSVTMYAARAPVHYEPEIILLTFASLYVFSIIMLVLLPPTGRAVRTLAVTPSSGLLLLAALAGFSLMLVFGGDVGNLLAPRYEKLADQISPLIAVGQGLLIASAAMMTAALVSSRKPRTPDIFSLLCCLSLLAIAFNPLNTSRFGLIAAWLPVGLILMPAVRKPLVFAAVAVGAIVVVMPILSVTTRFGWDLNRVLNSTERGSIGEIPYVDTFDALLHGVYYAHHYGLQVGAKILSILLCFVPRGLWPEKPVVSGLDIGNDLFVQGLVGTPNLSMPIAGDFYMDFGLIGVGLGAIVAAVGCRGLLRTQPAIGGYPIYGYLIIGALPIVERGAVGAVILLPASTLIACSLLTALSRRHVVAATA